MNFITAFRNLSIALLIWSAFWFLYGFFKRLWKTLNEKEEDK